MFTYDKDHLYEGKYNSSGKAVMSFNAAVHPALLTLMAIDHLGIDSTVPKKSTVKSAPFGKASGTLEVGSLVGAKVDHKAHSFAVILSIAGDAYTVKDYLWKNEYTVTKGDLLPVSPEGTAFKSGDKVLAVWPDDGRFYDGVLSKTDAKGAYVQWEDGSKESYVTFEKMIRK